MGQHHLRRGDQEGQQTQQQRYCSGGDQFAKLDQCALVLA